jgi:diguanylate cyclase (GGDEF)-like protein/PAS domain S-box-containing protein
MVIMLLNEVYILKSKKTCLKLGINPKSIPSFITVGENILEQKCTEYQEILSVVKFFVRKLLNDMKGTPILVIVSDEQGVVLEIEGDETIHNMMERLGITRGVRFMEETAGTNAISLALEHKQAIKVVGDDHYHSFLDSSVCYSVPFQYSDLGNILGTITIMASIEQANDFLFTLLSTVVDSIERELLLRSQNRKLNILNQIMMDASRTGIVLTDIEGNITDFNTYAEFLTGFKKENLIGKPVVNLDPFGKYIYNILQTHKDQEDMELVIEKIEEGTKKVCLFDGMPVYDERGILIGAVGKLRDITERHKVEEKISYMAHHDDLTGLPNRRFFHEMLGGALDAAMKSKVMMSVLLLDLDRFKMINDTLGHMQGDLLLVEVAKRLRDCIGDEGTVFRMGGDEFTILLPKIYHPGVATQWAKNIIELFKTSFMIHRYEFDVTASIGISYYPHDGQDINSLMIHADTAMFRAKEQGKNNFVVYTSSMNDKSYEKLALEKALRKAIVNDELVLYYQPQIELCTGKMTSMEALIRWQHPDWGLIPPDQFIPLAEETGLIVPIGEWVIRMACQQNKKWQDVGLYQARVAVNLSTYQFIKQGLVETVRKILWETGLDPRYLELEITESMTMDVDRSIVILRDLNDLGVEISIDDFGTGYSSLNYLKEFTIHRLKIDRSFVRDIMSDNKDARIVSTIISMAQGLGLEVVAEGVETREQLQFLYNANCNIVQGFYFCKPLPLNEFESLLSKKTGGFLYENALD